MTTIHNERAWEAGRIFSIVNNARKTFFKTFDRGVEVACYLGNPDAWDEGSFMHSVASAFQQYGKLTEKQYDAVCKVIDARKEKRLAWEKEAKEKAARSKHIGKIGDKIELPVMCINYYHNQKSYGEHFHIYTFEAEDGQILTCTGTVDFPDEENHYFKDTKYILKGTVKQHSEYKNIKQTRVIRVKLSIKED